MLLQNTTKLLTAIVLSWGIAACNSGPATEATTAPAAAAPSPAAPPPPASQEETLTQAAGNVRRYLAASQFDSLARYTPGGSVILFSPYGYVEKQGSQLLTAARLAALARTDEQLKWGTYDGSGEDIRLTVPAYFGKFVNDKDYANADSVKVNQVVRVGQLINNLATAFPGAEFVEYFCNGSEQYGYMDFGQLRLVFKKPDGKYQLIAVVHNQIST